MYLSSVTEDPKRLCSHIRDIHDEMDESGRIFLFPALKAGVALCPLRAALLGAAEFAAQRSASEWSALLELCETGVLLLAGI